MSAVHPRGSRTFRPRAVRPTLGHRARGEQAGHGHGSRVQGHGRRFFDLMGKCGPEGVAGGRTSPLFPTPWRPSAMGNCFWRLSSGMPGPPSGLRPARRRHPRPPDATRRRGGRSPSRAVGHRTPQPIQKERRRLRRRASLRSNTVLPITSSPQPPRTHYVLGLH